MKVLRDQRSHWPYWRENHNLFLFTQTVSLPKSWTENICIYEGLHDTPTSHCTYKWDVISWNGFLFPQAKNLEIYQRSQNMLAAQHWFICSETDQLFRSKIQTDVTRPDTSLPLNLSFLFTYGGNVCQGVGKCLSEAFTAREDIRWTQSNNFLISNRVVFWSTWYC